MRAASNDNPGVLIWPPVLLASSLAASILAHLAFPIRLFQAAQLTRIAGVVLALFSGFCALWASRVMTAAGTNVRPDRPAITIVKAGPFRFTRNPMYVSQCILQIGVALMMNSATALLFVVPLALVLHFGVIKREERYLTAKFGQDYLAFKSRVRRWL